MARHAQLLFRVSPLCPPSTFAAPSLLIALLQLHTLVNGLRLTYACEILDPIALV